MKKIVKGVVLAVFAAALVISGAVYMTLKNGSGDSANQPSEKGSYRYWIKTPSETVSEKSVSDGDTIYYF